MTVAAELLVRIAADSRQLVSEMNEAKRSVDSGVSAIKGAFAALGGVIAALGLGLAAQQFVATADSMAQLDARLKLATGSLEEHKKAQADVYRIAQANNVGLKEAGELWAKLNGPIKSLGGTARETTAVTEAFAIALRVGGAGAQEASAATLQFAQALASGTLRGDEFNSINEASPRVMKALADGMGVPIGQLRKMAEEGKLTADVVGNALMKSLDQLRKEAQQMPDTVGGAFQRLKNDAAKAIDELNRSKGLTLGIAGAIDGARELVNVIGRELSGAFEAVAQWVEDNRAGLALIAQQASSLWGDLWEAAKAIASWVGYLSSALRLADVLGGIFAAVRLAVAGIKDGTKMLAAGFASMGSLILESVLAPLQLVLTASAKIAGVFDRELADKIAGISAQVGEFARAGRNYANQVVADFAAGKTSVAALVREFEGGKRATDALADAQRAKKAATEAESAALGTLKAAQAADSKEKEKAEAAYKKLIDGINEKIALTKAEASTQEKLTEGQKLQIKVAEDLRNGTLKLTDAQKREVDTKLERLIASEREREAMEAERKAQEELRKEREKAVEQLDKQIEGIRQETARQKEANDTLGMTKAELAEVTAARYEALAAQAEAIAKTEEEANGCTELAVKQRDLAEAYREAAGEVRRGVHLEAAKSAADEWQKTIDQVGQGLTDSLFRAFESGKDFFSTLWDGIKNTLKTTVLRVLIAPVQQGMTSIIGGIFGLGGSGAALAGDGGGSGGLGSLLSAGKSAWDFLTGGWQQKAVNGIVDVASLLGKGGFENASAWLANNSGMLSSVIGGAGGFLAGRGIGQAISGGYALGGGSGNTAVNLGAAIGALAGPLGSAIGGAIGGLVNRAFGRGPKETTASGIEGTISGGDATGRTWAKWRRKGGWFRSTKRGTDYGELADETAAALDEGARAVMEQTKAWADALKLPADKLLDVTTSFKVTLTKDEEANQKAIADLFAKYQADLVGAFEGVLAPFQRAGETLVETMQRLGALQAFSTTINDLGGVFSAVAGASIAARENLIELAGGIDALIAASRQFASDYYTQDEQAGIAAKQTLAALESLGIDGKSLASREDFRALVESLGARIEDAEAQKQLVALLNLGPQFAQLADYLKEQGKTLEEAARAAPQTAILDQLLSPTQSTAEATAAVADKIDTSNGLLASIVDAVKSGNLSIASGLAQLATVTAQVAAAAQTTNALAAETNRRLGDLSADGSLAGSAPAYLYDMGTQARP